jgi:hypothetical protein
MDNSVLDSPMDSSMDSRLTIPLIHLDLALAVVGYVNVDGFAVVEMTTPHMIIITTTNQQGPLNKGVGNSLQLFILYSLYFYIRNKKTKHRWKEK